MLLNDQWIALLKITFSLTLSLYTVQTNNKDVYIFYILGLNTS